MPRLLIDGQRFEALSSSALYEGQYTRLLLQHADTLFPGLKAIAFSPIVVSDSVGKRADMALIEPDYSRWWVVEVELSHHSLEGHVAPQVAVLARAAYGADAAAWISDRNPDLDSVALRQMMRGEQPEVLVIVNASRPEWVTRLRPDAEVMVVEPFRSDFNKMIFRQNGVELTPGSSVLSFCRVHSILRRMLVVESPAAISMLGTEPFMVEYEGSVSSWKQIPTGDQVWLAPERSSPFPVSTRVALVRRVDGGIMFQNEEDL
ncbi:MAG: hypothetical protein JSS68_20325 [Actinobacteria bacterium]|nr:hypothetical protein [Actinomycetota bacterium]